LRRRDFVGSRCAASGARSTANPSSREPVKQRASCPGRGAAFFTMHRRAGTHGPRISSAPRRKSGPLRSIRGTHPSSPKTQLRNLAARGARVVHLSLAPFEGVGNAGCPMHPRSRVHLVAVERTRVTTSTPESPGIPARNGFNGLLRALPGDRAFLPPLPRGLKVLSGPVEPNEPPQDLTPASRRQDHTTSPSASSAVVLRAANRSRRAIRPALRNRTPDAAASTASRPAFVTIAIRPLCGTRQRCL
jgi:hypothetical protein